MGNITVDKLNGKSVNDEFMNISPILRGGDLCSQCDGKNGLFRVFNAISSIPPSEISGDNDYFVNSYKCDVNYHKIVCYNARGDQVWERIKTNGIWMDWVSIQNEIQVNDKLSKKVDVVSGKQLSDENYTLSEKQKLANVTTHFKGLFNSYTELVADGCVTGDYAFVKGDPNASIWYFKDGAWKDSGSTLGGSMMKEIYDPYNVAKDMYARSNHTGTQPISTIELLQATLDAKLNKTEKTKVVDNFESSSGTDALSANCGNVLNKTIHSIMTDATSIDYGSYFGETGGYAKLTSGLIIQFGQVKTASNTAKQDFVFPIPFPNKCYVVLATCESGSSSGSGVDGVYASVIDKTKASIVHDYKNVSVGTLNHYVLAIGN